MKFVRITPNPGQESVWDYPRPPRLEHSDKRIQVIFNDVMIADTVSAIRILETSHPPVYCLPVQSIVMQYLIPTSRETICEWKGVAKYYSIEVNEKKESNAAWYYPEPHSQYMEIKDHVAFYAYKMASCLVNGEKVIPQPGKFYGGWITKDIVGPFKGESGTQNW